MGSESTSEVKFFNNQSYEIWRMQMKGVLYSHDLWKIVNGDCACPVANTSGDANSIENVERWIDMDEKAKTFIMVAIDEPGWNQIKDCKTSNEMWLKLEEMFEPKGTDLKTVLMKRLLSLNMNEEDICVHVEDFCDTVNKLTKMEVAIDENLLCTILLQSLPYSFQNFRRDMESLDELPPLEDLARKIIEKVTKKGKNSKNPWIIGNIVAIKNSTGPDELAEKIFSPVTDSIFKSKKIDGRTCWFLDSKIPYHICNEALASRIKPAVGAGYDIKEGPNWTLNPGTLNITSQGSKSSLTIQGILCIQGFNLNILSVGRLGDMGYQVIFETYNVRIVDKNGRTILTGYKLADLYWFVEDGNKETTLAYDDAKPEGKSAGIFERLTKWLGLSWWR